MFGLLKGCGCGLGKEGKKNWNSHVCGLCLSLKDGYGQIYRLITNYDAPLLTVLSEAQGETIEKINSFCPLHRPFNQKIISPANVSSKFASSVSLLIAAAKVNDHIHDGDIWYFPKMIKNLTKRWIEQVRENCEKIGLSVDFILEQFNRQLELEKLLHNDFYFYSKPTELSVAWAFSSTSVISGNKGNYDGLFQLGEMYGRLMYLIDSYKDYDSDIKYKKFNPLAQKLNKNEIKDYVTGVYRDTMTNLKNVFNSLELAYPLLAHKLFFHELSNIGNKIIYCAEGPDYGGSNQQFGHGTYYDPNYQPPAPYDQDPNNMKKRKKEAGDDDGCCDCPDDCNCNCSRGCCGKNGSSGCCDYTCFQGCDSGCNCNHCDVCHGGHCCDSHSCCHGCDCHGCDCNCCDCNGCDCN